MRGELAKSKVAAATKAVIIVNSPNPALLQPKKDTTRAEAIAFMYQDLVRTRRLSTIKLPYIVSALPS